MLNYIQKKKIEEYKKRCNILGVNYDSDISLFKIKYKKLIKKYHPDISKEKNCKEKTQEVLDAYDGIFELRDEVINILSQHKIEKAKVKKKRPVFVNNYDDLVGDEEGENLDKKFKEFYDRFVKNYEVFKEDFSESDPVAKAYFEMLKNRKRK